MEMSRRLILQASPGLFLAGAAAGQGAAWRPDGPVTLVVPSRPAGATDLLGQVLAPMLAAALSQRVERRNVPGEAGVVAADHVARSRPDGLALLLAPIGIFAFNPHFFRRSGTDPLTDLVPIGLVGTSPMVLLASRHSGIADLSQLRARAHAGMLTVGSGSCSSAMHMGAVLLMMALGSAGDLIALPGDTHTRDLLQAGLIDVVVDHAATALPAIHLGVRPLAVTGATRLPMIAAVPTAAEAGLPTFDLSVWHVLAAPRGTPPEITQALAAALDVGLEDDMLAERFATHAVLLPPVAERGPAAAAGLIAREHERWGRIIRAAGIEGEG